jgi:hypothetical protein
VDRFDRPAPPLESSLVLLMAATGRSYPQRKVQVLLIHRFRAGNRLENQVVDRTQCDKTGAILRQNGFSVATKWVGSCDKTGAPGRDATKGVLLEGVATKRVPIDFAVRRTCVFGRKALFSAVRASCGIARRTVLAGALRQKGCNKGRDTNRLRVAIYPHEPDARSANKHQRRAEGG